MSKPSSAAESVQMVQNRVTDICDHLNSLQNHDLSDVRRVLNPLERAKLDVSLAYTLGSLLYVLQKVKGEKLSKDLQDELNRLKTYIETVKSHGGEKIKPTMSIDSSAASRLILFELLKK